MAGVKNGIVYSEEYGSYKYHFTWQCCGQDPNTGAKVIDWALVSDVGGSYTECNVQIYFYDQNTNILDIHHVYPWKANPFYGASASYGYGENIDYGKITCPLNTYYIAIEGYCYINGGIGLSIAGSWILTDEYIPSPSAISCKTTDIGKTATINITHYDMSASVNISYSFGSLSGTIIEGYSGDSYSGWVVPTSFYDEMKDADSKKCTLTAVTTINGVVIGTETCIFTVTIDSVTNAPSISATIIDTNSDIVAITQNEAKFIKGYSTAQVTVTATASNGATIANCIIKNNNRTINAYTASFSSVSDNVFEITVTDSRGISNTQIYSIDMIEYKNITCTISASPPTTDGATEIIIQGTYTNGSLGATSNAATIQYRYYAQGTQAGDWVNVEHDINNNTYKAELSFTDLDYKTAYVFEAKAIDVLSEASSSVVAKTTPVFSWSNDDFEFNVDVNVNGKVEASSVEISGNAKIGGNIDIDGNFDLGGDLTVGTLAVDDDATIIGKLTVGEIQSNENISATGDISTSGNLDVSGTATISSLEVSGSADFDGNTNFQNGINVSGSSSFSDDVTFSNTVTMNNGATVNGSLSVSNSATFNNVTVNGTLTTTWPFKDHIIEYSTATNYGEGAFTWMWTYRKWASGFCECWGHSTPFTFSSVGYEHKECPFPVTFRTTNYVLQHSLNVIASSSTDYEQVGEKSMPHSYEAKAAGHPRTASGTWIRLSADNMTKCSIDVYVAAFLSS